MRIRALTCYSIVAHHGGLITAESNPEEGSVPRVYLPAANEKRKVVGMIFDLTIPGGTGGKEAAGDIRKISKELPIFITSGYSRDPVMEDPAKYGFNARMCKPFSLEELSLIHKEHLK